MAATSTAARTRTINIRIEEERRTLIDRAGEQHGAWSWFLNLFK